MGFPNLTETLILSFPDIENWSFFFSHFFLFFYPSIHHDEMLNNSYSIQLLFVEFGISYYGVQNTSNKEFEWIRLLPQIDLFFPNLKSTFPIRLETPKLNWDSYFLDSYFIFCRHRKLIFFLLSFFLSFYLRFIIINVKHQFLFNSIITVRIRYIIVFKILRSKKEFERIRSLPQIDLFPSLKSTFRKFIFFLSLFFLYFSILDSPW